MNQIAQGASAPTIFNFNSHAVRVVLRDGEPWFVATDVCAALGYANSRKAVADHLDDDERGVTTGYTLGGDQRLIIISESGLYALVLRSRKPEARKFAKWVTGEVLPTIRKSGGYHVSETVVQPAPTLHNRRWLVSYDHTGKEQVKPIPDDACVMTIPQMLKAINEPNGLMVESDVLFKFMHATLTRLEQRYEFYKKQAKPQNRRALA